MSRSFTDLMGMDFDKFCRLLSFISHLAELLSACFTVHFTMQRFIAVRFPLSVFIERKNQFLHYLIVTLFIVFGISYCLALIKYNHYDSCEEELQLNWFISDALSSFVVPFTMIAVLNLLIIFHLRRASRNNPQILFGKRSQRNALSNGRRKSCISCDSFSQAKQPESPAVPIIKVLLKMNDFCILLRLGLELIR